MKKLSVVAMAAMLCAGGAFAVSITVPFFSDDGAADGVFAPENNFKTYIGLLNVSEETREFAVTYFDVNAGQDVTPAENTFSLGPQESIGWRPSTVDAAVEGAGADMPKMTSGIAGSATIYWDGNVGDAVGRIIQIGPGGASAYGVNVGSARAAE